MTKQDTELELSDRYQYILVSIDLKTFTKLSDEYNEYNNMYTAINLWCDQNCTGNWSWIETTMWGFESEEDAMAFKLRWT